MATIVVAAGGGNSNATGTYVGGVLPTAADDVQLNATSGNFTLNAAFVARSVDCSGAGISSYTGTLTHNNSVTATIGDATAGLGNIALKLVAGMTYTIGGNSANWNFISTSATVQTVDFAGKNTGGVVFNAASNGSWKYTGSQTQSAGYSGASVNLTKGTLDLNGQTVTWNWFQSNSGSVRSLIGNNATINLNGGNSQNRPWITTTSGFTTSLVGTIINFNETYNAGFYAFDPGGVTVGTVVINVSNGGWATLGSSTIGTLNMTSTANITLQFANNSTTNVTNWGITGSGSQTVSLRTATSGTTATINKTGANISSDYLSIQDIIVTGTLPAYAGKNSINNGNNTDWLFSPPFSFVQTATGSSGGTASLAITLGASAGASNLFVINIKTSTSPGTITITDNAGGGTNVYAQSTELSGGGFNQCQMYGVQVNPGATIVTLTFSISVAVRAVVDEYSGNATSNANVYDISATNSGTDTSSSVSLIPSSAYNLIVANLALSSPTTITPGANYTIGANAVTSPTEYRLIGTTSETAPASWTGSQAWTEIATSFRPYGSVASVGGSSNPTMLLLGVG